MPKPLRALIVDDSAHDADLMVRLLERDGYDVTSERVEDAAAFRTALEGGQWDVVLADYIVPCLGGLDALEPLRAIGLDIPFIVVTDAIGEETAVQAMRAGANDYVMKGNMRRLAPAIDRELREAESRRERRLAQGALREAEARFRSLFENSLDGILLTVPDGRVLAANADACLMLGRTEEEICRLGRAGVVDSADPRLSAALEERARTGRFTGELNLLHVDGTRFPCEVSSSIFRDKDGNLQSSVSLRDISERKRAEEVLQESEKRFRHLIENVSDIIMALDSSGIIRYESPAIERVLGYTPAELVGQSAFELVHPDDIQAVSDLFERAISVPGVSVSTELRYRHRDGSWRMIEGTGKAMMDDQGQVMIVVNMRDISERKRAEEALLESEQRLRAVLNSAPITIFATDSRAVFTLHEGKGLERLGMKPGGNVGLSALEFYKTLPIVEQTGKLTTVEDVIHRVLAGETVEGITELEGIYFDNQFAPMSDKNGRVIGLVGIANDITERRQAEAEIARLLRAVESSGEVIFLTDREGVITYVNPEFTRLYGYTAGEVVGRATPRILKSEVAAPQDYEVFWKTLLGGKVDRGEWVNKAKDGRLVEVDGSASPILDNEGNIVGFLAVQRDITERKRSEDAIRREVVRSEALLRVAERLNAELTLPAVLNAVCEETAAALKAPTVTVNFYNEAEGVLSHSCGTGVPPTFLERVQPWPRAIFDEYIQQFGPVGIIHDVQEVPDFLNAALYADLNVHTMAVAAMRHKGILVGSMNIVTYDQERDFTEDELTLLRGLADQASQALVNARLFDESQRRLRDTHALHTIDTAISSSLDLRLTLNVVLEQVTAQLGVDAADILLLNPHMQTLEYAAGRGFWGRGIERSRLRIGEGQAGLAALEGRMVSIPRLSESTGALARGSLLAGEDFVSYYAAPLMTKGQVRGVLEIFHRSTLRPDDEWRDFLDALASQTAIAIENASLFKGLQRSNLDLALAYDATIEGWSRALDLRDKETEGHSQRVTEMTVDLARAMGTPEAELAHVRRGALLHDIGKMGVPDSILFKPGSLTEDEWVQMRKHPTYAYDLLYPIAYLRQALDIPYCHHEKWDGTGYPRGLKGEQIPLAARIFAALDVWDALTSERPYRPAWEPERALELVRSTSGSHLDPKVVEAFLRQRQ